jgi:hypothetical protein
MVVPMPDLEALYAELAAKATSPFTYEYWQPSRAKPIFERWLVALRAEIQTLRGHIVRMDCDASRLAAERDAALALVAEREAEIGELEWPEIDYSLCPYYTKIGDEGAHGPNTCSFGCSDEPVCQTSHPGEEGWPGEQHPLVRNANAERDAALAAIAAVRELHQPIVLAPLVLETSDCENCGWEWPCPTERAIREAMGEVE